jgi:acyl-CoA synthetase (NDP forming)
VEPPISSHPLARLLEPRGVAVVGASENPAKYGCLLLKTLIEEGYAGAIHPVNPNGGALLGRRFLASLDEASGPVDVALIVRPAQECVAAVKDVARRRVPFAIVYAAGFSERGEEGRRLERELVAAAAAGGTRVVGPNGMNIVSVPARLNLSAIVPFPPGRLGFLSASGNLGYALAHEASRRGGIGFSRFISVGNQADLALDEYLDFLCGDPETAVVFVYVEGFVRGRARRFLDALARTAARKPVLVLRGGRTRVGSGTARSHTGALTSEPALARRALEQAGAVLLDRADEALAVAQALLESPLPRGGRTVLVGEGGGHATLLADAASEAGLALEPLPAELIERLRPHLPPFAAIVRNPVELGGVSEQDVRVYERVAGPLLEWQGCDQLVLFGGYALYDEPLAAFLAARRTETGKPILVHDLYADEQRPAFAPLRSHGVPYYASADVTLRAAGALARAGAGRHRARRSPASVAVREEPSLPDDLAAALAAARSRPERALAEEPAARLLAHFGVPSPRSELARSPEEAVAAARRLGYPVVIKVHSASIVHKSGRGGVRLDLRSDAEVNQAYDAMRPLAPEPPLEVRVTPFLPGGAEALLGARRDAEFGPVIAFGSGGLLAEAVADVSFRTLPCAQEELSEMVRETRLGARLAGTPGSPPVDLGALHAALRGLAHLVLSLPEVADAEVNPLSCRPDGVLALDARVLLSP